MNDEGGVESGRLISGRSEVLMNDDASLHLQQRVFAYCFYFLLFIIYFLLKKTKSYILRKENWCTSIGNLFYSLLNFQFFQKISNLQL